MSELKLRPPVPSTFFHRLKPVLLGGLFAQAVRVGPAKAAFWQYRPLAAGDGDGGSSGKQGEFDAAAHGVDALGTDADAIT